MSQKKEAVKEYKTRRIKEMVGILRKHKITEGMTPEKLRLIISDLGPTYIKLGQILSMRQDLLPKEYCQELMKLQTNVNPLEFEEIKVILEDEYGQNVYDIFSEISTNPLGAASIAQVHKAKLKKNNKDVVIKVQRPGIYSTMQNDISLMRRAAKMLKKISPKATEVIDLEAVLKEMWEAAKQEMNFTVEAQNAQKFSELNKDVVYFDSPTIYPEYSNDKVLVMDFIPGIDIDQNEILIKNGYDLDDLAQKLATNYIKQVIVDGFFHADPHPGNIRIHDDKIAFIDLGMMGTLTSQQRKQFNRAINAIAFHNSEELKSAFLQIGVQNGDIDDSKLYEEIDSILEEYGDLDLTEINLGKFLEEMLEICTKNHISMPSDITLLARGILTLESVVAEISPTSNMIKIMSDFVVSQKKLPEIKETVQKYARKGVAFTDATLQVPTNINEISEMLLKGHTKINLELIGSEKPLAAISKMINRLVFGIIVAALLIGSSFLATTNMNPKILGIPALGFIGYLVSVILGFWIIIQMIKQDKNLDKK